MHLKLLELLAFLISAICFCYGGTKLFKKETLPFFYYLVCASGCYALEELWSIVDTIFGPGKESLLSVRLFGIFGCFCFMLSAFLSPPEKDRDYTLALPSSCRIIPFIGPVVSVALYGLYTFVNPNHNSTLYFILGFLSVCPSIPVFYLGLKNLFSKSSAPKEAKKGLNRIYRLSLGFVLCNFLFLVITMQPSVLAVSLFDCLVSLLLAAAIMFCAKEAPSWKIPT